MELIKLENIFKTYRIGEIDVPVLKGVSLNVERGEMVALMGASGSGKTTLMNILGCLDHATSGKYWLDGEDISGFSADQRALVRNRKIGFVFQTFNLLSNMTAQKNVELPMLYSGISPEVRKQRAITALERVGLGDRGHHRPSELSGGQNQRMAIARALVNNPAIILADEPTGALDSRNGAEIMAIFQELHREGATIVLVTHDPDIARHAQRILRFRDGLLVGDEAVLEQVDACQVLALWEEEVTAG
jgi:putative ABC transport system ATP-binding protein